MREGNMQLKPRFCSNCGAPIFDGQFFCQNCGYKLDVPQQAQAEEPAQTWQEPQAEGPQQIWQQSQTDTQEQTFQYNSDQQVNYNNQMSQMGQQYYYGQTYQQNSYYGEQQTIPNQGMIPPNGPALSQKSSKQPMDPKKKKKRIILFSCLGVGFLTLIALAIFLLYYFSFTRIDASKVYMVTYEGINGKGRASVTLDTKVIPDLIKDMSNSKNIMKAYYISTITYEADPYEDLSNGDTIKIKVHYDMNDFDKYKIKLSNTTFEIKVDGLKEAEAYDLFKDLKVKFEGVNGYGIADIDTSNCDYISSNYVSYSFNQAYDGLKNGDKITVLADIDLSILEDKGLTTDVFEKEFTVEGLKELQSYDVFKDIKLTYNGVSPNLTVEIDNSACENDIKDNVYFYIEDNYNKKNGDKVTVYAQFNKELMLSFGYDIAEDRKEYTIENQGEFINQIGADAIKDIDHALTPLIETWMKAYGDGYLYEVNIANEYGEGYSLVEAKNSINKRYFANHPEGNPYNCYAAINKCTYKVMSSDKKDTQVKELYILVFVDDIAKNSDGTFSYTPQTNYLLIDDINKVIDNLNDSEFSFNEVKATE